MILIAAVQAVLPCLSAHDNPFPFSVFDQKKKKKDSISRYAEAKDLYFLISFARYCEYERGRGTEKEKGAFPGGGE